MQDLKHLKSIIQGPSASNVSTQKTIHMDSSQERVREFPMKMLQAAGIRRPSPGELGLLRVCAVEMGMDI